MRVRTDDLDARRLDLQRKAYERQTFWVDLKLIVLSFNC